MNAAVDICIHTGVRAHKGGCRLLARVPTLGRNLERNHLPVALERGVPNYFSTRVGSPPLLPPTNQSFIASTTAVSLLDACTRAQLYPPPSAAVGVLAEKLPRARSASAWARVATSGSSERGGAECRARRSLIRRSHIGEHARAAGGEWEVGTLGGG